MCNNSKYLCEVPSVSILTGVPPPTTPVFIPLMAQRRYLAPAVQVVK